MTTAAEALAIHYSANGLDADPALSPTWTCQIGSLRVRLPNWKWRGDAITRHDLHHILTGYPCTMTGEMQMAAWELAAGRYRHWATTLFCMPLALAGLIYAPRQTAKAFRNGLRSQSLYDLKLDLGTPLATLRAAIVKRHA